MLVVERGYAMSTKPGWPTPCPVGDLEIGDLRGLVLALGHVVRFRFRRRRLIGCLVVCWETES
jgi:hypothetical protein